MARRSLIGILSCVQVSRVLFIVATAALLSSCVAEMVEKKKPRRGPVPEVGYIETGGGEVRYSTEGWDWIVATRRMTALRRMKRVCKGKDLEARVTDEFTRDDVDATYHGNDLGDNINKGLEHYQVAPYRHIVFDCVPKSQPEVKL
jgi:hypothetical protein